MKWFSWLDILLATKSRDWWQCNFRTQSSTIDSKLSKHGQLRWQNGHITSTKHIGSIGTSSTFTSCSSATAKCKAFARSTTFKFSTTVRIINKHWWLSISQMISWLFQILCAFNYVSCRKSFKKNDKNSSRSLKFLYSYPPQCPQCFQKSFFNGFLFLLHPSKHWIHEKWRKKLVQNDSSFLSNLKNDRNEKVFHEFNKNQVKFPFQKHRR